MPLDDVDAFELLALTCRHCGGFNGVHTTSCALNASAIDLQHLLHDVDADRALTTSDHDELRTFFAGDL